MAWVGGGAGRARTIGSSGHWADKLPRQVKFQFLVRRFHETSRQRRR